MDRNENFQLERLKSDRACCSSAYTTPVYVDWTLDDPAGADIDMVRRVRDEIRERVEALLLELGVSGTQKAMAPRP